MTKEAPIQWHVEPPAEVEPESHPYFAWHRIMASDGATVAYVPDSFTAERIVRADKALAILTKALEPFAACAAWLERNPHPKDVGLWTPTASFGPKPPSIHTSHVYAARAALANRVVAEE